MAKYKKQTTSEQSLLEAQAITKGTQKPGQTKEQSKLIAQGIAKGIEQYKKQQKAKAREKDKLRKKDAKLKTQTFEDANISKPRQFHLVHVIIPWALLFVSWVGFIILRFGE